MTDYDRDERVRPFELAIAQSDLDDLRERLVRTRWPERESVDDQSQGAPLRRVRELCAYWRDRYDWRRCEAKLNAFGQFRTRLDGLDIHFIHRRSPEPEALPLILTHGWPGSIIEFHKIIGPLTDPVAHGGKAEDAFHLVVPSLPGYGFSEKPSSPGWGVPRIALAWLTLMRRLGYERFVAQGGDWGASVTAAMGMLKAPELLGVHLNLVMAQPAPEDMADLTDREIVAMEAMKRHGEQGTGYSKQQSTRPQTLGYGLVDSPAGQAAWIYEKFAEWADCRGDPHTILSFDEMLDNIMLYWLPGAGASSARLYWESYRNFANDVLDIPVMCSIFRDIVAPSRRWAARKYTNIIYWNELEYGGHFAAFEQPELFVEEIRSAFRLIR